MQSIVLSLFSCFLLLPSAYSNCLKGDCINGFGVYIYKSGAKYKGEFVKGQIHGQGTLTMKNGDKYTGSWVDNRRHGQGTYWFANGDIYEGHFFRGKLQGEGRMHYHSGYTYQGQWHENRTHGKGAMTYPDESVYTGDFIAGKKEGQGTMYYSDGRIFKGSWRDGQRHGPGTLYPHEGQATIGTWLNGDFSGEKVSGASDFISAHHANHNIIKSDGEVKIFALLIGISRYDHMPSLKFTDDDAYRLFAFFKSPEGGALPDEQVSILVDETATRQRILLELERLGRAADADDVLLVYFSGHGLQGSFLPFDFDGYHNQLAHRDLMNGLNQSYARQKILLADACHSGGMPYYKGTTTIELHPFYDAFRRSGGGTALFLSSRADEVSLEDHSLRQGIFSHFLIRGLKGEADQNRDQLIDLDEISTFVQQGVRDYTNGRQHPVLHGDIDTGVPLAFIR